MKRRNFLAALLAGPVAVFAIFRRKPPAPRFRNVKVGYAATNIPYIPQLPTKSWDEPANAMSEADLKEFYAYLKSRRREISV